MYENLRKNYYQQGASLVEMVIVLAIIGLLVALIAGAVNIRNASQIRGFISDINGFQVAFEGFESKYGDLPGDITDAQERWGTGETQDGNGNVQIEYPVVGDKEALRAWQHLDISGFLEGGYTGEASTSWQADIGINVPASSRSKVGYYVIYQNFIGGAGTSARNEFVLGAFKSGEANSNAALSPQEANSVDMKMDDGNPSDGKVFGTEGDNGSDCVNGAADAYDITNDNIACILSFSIEP